MMCIADMEIKSPNYLIKDLIKKVKRGNFTYTYLNEVMHSSIAK
jgi:bifunctional pyridoxal-dependent enzyme with beta-cystathionase and maltose regulon repressor activities